MSYLLKHGSSQGGVMNPDPLSDAYDYDRQQSLNRRAMLEGREPERVEEYTSPGMPAADEVGAIQSDSMQRRESALTGAGMGIPVQEPEPAERHWTDKSLAENVVDILPLGDGSLAAGIKGVPARLGEIAVGGFDFIGSTEEALLGTKGVDWLVRGRAGEESDFLKGGFLSDLAQIAAVPFGMHNLGKIEENIQAVFGNREKINKEYAEHSFESIGESENVLQAAGNLANWVIKEGPPIVVDGFVAVLSAPLYIAARTGEMTQERQENTGEATDLFALGSAAATAAIFHQMEKFGLEASMAKVLIGKSATRLKRILTGAAAEGLTEAPQEYWETLLTGVKKDLSNLGVVHDEAKMAALQGMILGGVVGGTLGGVTADPNAVQVDDTEVLDVSEGVGADLEAATEGASAGPEASAAPPPAPAIPLPERPPEAAPAPPEPPVAEEQPPEEPQAIPEEPPVEAPVEPPVAGPVEGPVEPPVEAQAIPEEPPEHNYPVNPVATQYDDQGNPIQVPVVDQGPIDENAGPTEEEVAAAQQKLKVREQQKQELAEQLGETALREPMGEFLRSIARAEQPEMEADETTLTQSTISQFLLDLALIAAKRNSPTEQVVAPSDTQTAENIAELEQVSQPGGAGVARDRGAPEYKAAAEQVSELLKLREDLAKTLRNEPNAKTVGRMLADFTIALGIANKLGVPIQGLSKGATQNGAEYKAEFKKLAKVTRRYAAELEQDGTVVDTLADLNEFGDRLLNPDKLPSRRAREIENVRRMIARPVPSAEAPKSITLDESDAKAKFIEEGKKEGKTRAELLKEWKRQEAARKGEGVDYSLLEDEVKPSKEKLKRLAGAKKRAESRKRKEVIARVEARPPVDTAAFRETYTAAQREKAIDQAVAEARTKYISKGRSSARRVKLLRKWNRALPERRAQIAARMAEMEQEATYERAEARRQEQVAVSEELRRERAMELALERARQAEVELAEQEAAEEAASTREMTDEELAAAEEAERKAEEAQSTEKGQRKAEAMARKLAEEPEPENISKQTRPEVRAVGTVKPKPFLSKAGKRRLRNAYKAFLELVPDKKAAIAELKAAVDEARKRKMPEGGIRVWVAENTEPEDQAYIAEVRGRQRVLDNQIAIYTERLATTEDKAEAKELKKKLEQARKDRRDTVIEVKGTKNKDGTKKTNGITVRLMHGHWPKGDKTGDFRKPVNWVEGDPMRFTDRSMFFMPEDVWAHVATKANRVGYTDKAERGTTALRSPIPDSDRAIHPTAWKALYMYIDKLGIGKMVEPDANGKITPIPPSIVMKWLLEADLNTGRGGSGGTGGKSKTSPVKRIIERMQPGMRPGDQEIEENPEEEPDEESEIEETPEVDETPEEEPDSDEEGFDDEDLENLTVEQIDDLLDGLLGTGKDGPGNERNFVNIRKLLIDQIDDLTVHLERFVASRKSWVENLLGDLDPASGSVKLAPTEKDGFTFDTPGSPSEKSVPLLAKEFIARWTDPKGEVEAGMFLTATGDRPLEEKVAEVLNQQLDLLEMTVKSRLKILTTKLEKLDATASNRGYKTGTRKPKKQGVIEGFKFDTVKRGKKTEGPSRPAGGTDGTPVSGGAIDPTSPERRAVDLFGGAGPDPVSLAPIMARIRATLVSGNDGVNPLRDYQEEGVAIMLKRYLEGKRGTLNMDGAGLGKTRQLIGLAKMIAEEGKGTDPVLIVLPNAMGEPGGKPNAAVNKWYTQLLEDAAEMGVDLNELYENGDAKFRIVTYRGFVEAGQSGKFKAVLADEATKLKKANSSTTSINFERLNTPYVGFFTATPTDLPGQEMYYMTRVIVDTVDGKSLKGEKQSWESFAAQQLGLAKRKKGEGYGLATGAKTKSWHEKLTREIAAAVKEGGIIGRVVPRTSINSVVDIEEYYDGQYVDPVLQQQIEEIYKESPNNAHWLNEHAKVDYAIERSIEAIRMGEKPIVVVDRSTITEAVQKSLEDAGVSRKYTRYTPMQRYVRGMEEAGYKVSVLAAPTDKSSGIKFSPPPFGRELDKFNGLELRDGEKVAMPESQRTDAVIGSLQLIYYGLNLNDGSTLVPSQPRRMIILSPGNRGDVFIQLLGRHDRSNNLTYAFTEVAKLRNPADFNLRELVGNKLLTADVISGRNQASPETTERIRKTPDFSEEDEFGRIMKMRAADRAPEPTDTTVNRLTRRGTSPVALLDRIAKDTESEGTREVADWLRSDPEALENVEIKPFDEETRKAFPEALAVYDPESGTVYVGEESGSTRAVLHELAHHRTLMNLRAKPDARLELERIMNMVLRKHPKLDAKFFNAFRNQEEFIAEAFGNPELRKLLQDTHIAGPKTPNLWTRFKNFLHRILGVTGPQATAFDHILELNLTETMDSTGLSTTPVEKLKIPTPQGASASKKRKRTTKLQGLVRSGASKVAKTMLHGMTYKQIVEVYESLFEREIGTDGGNLARQLESLTDRQQAASTRHAQNYDQKVNRVISKFMREHGKKMVRVRLAANEKPVLMSQGQYLATIMNVSGYNGLHFGRAETDPANTVLGKVPPKPGKKRKKQPKPVAHAKAAWDLHKKQFDNPGLAEMRKVYNGLATYFEQENEQHAKAAAAAFLDTIPDAQNKQAWATKSLPEVRKEIKRLQKLTASELKVFAVSKASLKELSKMLNPKKAAGAYFPLRRFGDHVVTVDHELEYTTELERDALLEEYPNAKDVPSKKTKGSGKIRYKSMDQFESQDEARRFAEEMEEKFKGTDAIVTGPMPKAEAAASLINQKSNISISALAQGFEENMRRRIAGTDVTEQEVARMRVIFGNALLDMLPSASPVQSQRRRQGIAGASTDIVRVLHQHGTTRGHQLAQLEYSGRKHKVIREMIKHATAMERRMGEVDRYNLRNATNTLISREYKSKDLMEMTNVAQGISDIGFVWYLVGASYNIVNMTQVPLMTFTELASRYGAVKASAALIRAYRQAGKAPMVKMLKTGGSLTELRHILKDAEFDPENYQIIDEIKKGLKGDQLRMIEQLVLQGVIDVSLAMDMARNARRPHVDEKGNPRGASKLDYLTDWMRMAPHTIEVMNRTVTALAAYDLETQRNKGDHNKAMEYAKRTVEKTQFVYANFNKLPIMQSQTGRIALMFKSHVQHMYYYMLRNVMLSFPRERPTNVTEVEFKEQQRQARRALSYFVLMHVLATGAVGGFPEPLKWLVQLAAWMFGDDDEPFDLEREVRNAAFDLMGPEAADLVSYGLPGLVGLDLSGRVGIDSMLVFEGPDFSTPDAFLASVAEIAGGPMLALGAKAATTGREALVNGEYQRFAETMAPKAIKDVIKSGRISEEGFVDLKGKRYASADELSPFQYTMMALGFAPSDASTIYEARSARGTFTAMSRKRTKLIDLYIKADDRSSRQSRLDDIKEWNRRNPQFKITWGNIKRSNKRRVRSSKDMVKGVYVDKAQRPWLREQLRSY